MFLLECFYEVGRCAARAKHLVFTYPTRYIGFAIFDTYLAAENAWKVRFLSQKPLKIAAKSRVIFARYIAETSEKPELWGGGVKFMGCV